MVDDLLPEDGPADRAKTWLIRPHPRLFSGETVAGKGTYCVLLAEQTGLNERVNARYNSPPHAAVAQLVERNLAKVEVESSRLFCRSKI